MGAKIMPSSDQTTQDFYNEFTSSRMLRYRLYGNPRLERATQMVLSFIKPHYSVLDIGCGIGIVSEKIASAIHSGHVWACDLADNNISYAKKTIHSDKITFFAVDVLENFTEVETQVQTTIDVVTMIDVIEHLPLDKHHQLFENISKIVSNNATIILTYPSPEYQQYLYKNEPQELQVIDEIVELSHLINVTQKAGFKLKSYAYQEGIVNNKYIYAVFVNKLDFDPAARSNVRLLEKVIYRVKSIGRKLLTPYLKYKYIMPLKRTSQERK